MQRPIAVSNEYPVAKIPCAMQRCFFLFLFLVFTASAGLRAHAETLTAFAAASLKDALAEVVQSYEKESGNKVTVSLAASSALAKQIENGAPADVFISADLDWMDYLQARKLIVDTSRVNLLRNTLVLIAPAGSTAQLSIHPDFPLAEALGDERLAVANPEHVPAGKYGRAALESLGVWPSVRKKVAAAENVRAALALVARGEAPFGIVYRTDARAEPKVKVVGEFPPDSHGPIVYPAAVIAASKNSAAGPLLKYLQSPLAQRIFQSHGFAFAK